MYINILVEKKTTCTENETIELALVIQSLRGKYRWNNLYK